ncbi:MAG: potassium transporter Kup [Clostridia bacterium]|nr:potassium transporter Kup [Deltaproteobacteria bacterium]
MAGEHNYFSSQPSPDGNTQVTEPSRHTQIREHQIGTYTLLIGALGVVFGDIGTSPLYALRECFAEGRGVPVTPENIIGILSLFFWALMIVVTFKYLVYVMRADNHGEGGILALLSLVLMQNKSAPFPKKLVLLGLFGSALLYSDGMLTPAVTVLSAVEGLEVATHNLSAFVIPITVAILVVVFLFQSRGTGRVGAVFGPLMLIWFVSIAAAGIPWIVRHPYILHALNPVHGLGFLLHHGLHGFWLLGSVVLCVTGAEALYADMGHFGRAPIRLVWLAIVLPALVINYFGQGALLVEQPLAIGNPFYALVPQALTLPMVVIATVASVIASQALISGAFSLSQQAIQLGYLPRLSVVHTSDKAKGQIYVPAANWVLMIACISIVLTFKSSANLAAAYGMAVTGTMTITTVLFYRVAQNWWGPKRALLLCGLYMCVDVPFLTANMDKLASGGWLPIAIATTIFIAMVTWKKGRAALGVYMAESGQPFDEFIEKLRVVKPHRVPGTAVFMTSSPAEAPPVLLHHYRHNRVLHEQIVLLSVMTEDIPRVRRSNLVEVTKLEEGFFRVVAHYGFTQTPRVTEILRQCERRGLHTDPADTSFYLGREKLVITTKRGMARWRKLLFSFMSQNSRSATDFFRIPPDRVVEIGMQVEL